MANTSSARKRVRQSLRHRERNMSLKNRMRTSVKKVIKATEEKIQQEIRQTEERVNKEKDLAISELNVQLKDSATNFISKVTKIEKGNITI